MKVVVFFLFIYFFLKGGRKGREKGHLTQKHMGVGVNLSPPSSC